MQTRLVLASVVIMMSVATGAQAHWESPAATFPWANPGAVRWAINYSRMDREQVQTLLDAGFNLIQGGSFDDDALQLAHESGAHCMAYICSRTIYHEKLFPDHPELRDAAILTPAGDYKVIYNNPARYAGCYNRSAWLDYIKEQMDKLQAAGLDCIFFDNPMTWACHCPTCRAEFRAYALEHTGTAYELGAENTPAELERWFTVDSAREFFAQVHAYARDREHPMFIVANNLHYWLVDQGLTDGLFTEAGGQAPFGRDVAAYKIGLAASHGKPTGILTYIPTAVRMARGFKRYAAPSASDRWYGAPVAEEYAAGLAMGMALGGNYEPNFSLTLGRQVLARTDPEDTRIIGTCERYGQFAAGWERLYAGQQPGSRVGVLYDLTAGPRRGDILGVRKGEMNQLLWLLQKQGIPADVIVNSDLTDNGLNGFAAILIDDAAMLSPDEMRGLREFVEGGGTLVLSAGLSIRDRFETADAARSISEFLPGCEDNLVREVDALQLDMDGYLADGGRIKAATEGTASLVFDGDEGPWTISVRYLDESDGVSDMRLLVNDEQIGAWQMDADDDQWHAFTSKVVRLSPRDLITVHGTHGGGEYARISAINLRSGEGGGVHRVSLGDGVVVQVAGNLGSAPEQSLAVACEALRRATPVCGDWPDTVLLNLMRQPRGNILGAHIVNFDYEYGDNYVLKTIHPTPEIALRVQAPALKVARLISPDMGPQDLPITDGEVTVPAITNYAVVLLATDEATLDRVAEE